jgi:hypothetical protein
MENTSANKSLSDSILEMTKSITPASVSTASVSTASASNAVSSSTSAGVSSGFLGISFFTWIIIIIVLAFLGFNIFSYLSQGSAYLAAGTEQVNMIFGPLIRLIFGTSVAVAGNTIDVAAEGGKAVISGTATGVNAGLSAVQDITPNKASGSMPNTSVEDHNQEMEEAKNSLNSVLNKSSQNSNKNTNNSNDYEPHQASSSVHDTGRAGWCFIGEDRGHRTCTQVSETDKCMSGDIFPSQEICINPSLRA